jgi:N-acyl-D-amino-acid deacylase
MLLRNARVIDGTGAPAFAGHVLIDGERLGAVLRQGEEVPPADLELDLAGYALAPGFIDMHSHADFVLPLEDHGELLRPFLEQGVTTVVAGNCGFSPAPVTERSRLKLDRASAICVDRPLPWTGGSMRGLLDSFQHARPAANVAELVGHAAIRYASADSPRGPLTTTELRRSTDLARQALEEGACGLSFGLGYDPGMYAPLEELEALSRVAAVAGKPVTVHMKAFSRLSPCYPLTDLRPHNLRALREILAVGRRSGARLQLSHFIFVGRRTWPSAPRALAMVDAARRAGQDVAIDAFPYTCGNTTILAPIPYWFLAMRPRAYTSPLARARLRLELEVGFRLVGFLYEDFQVMEIAVPEWEELNGLTVVEIGRQWGVGSFEALLRIAERSSGDALMLFHAYSGDRDGNGPIDSVLEHESCLYETDAVVRSRGWPNPAAVGAFPRVLGTYVRERRLLALEDAIQRMTGLSAARFGLTDRGVIAAGKAADLVVFDPRRIADRPGTAGEPPARPTGIEHVFVNGHHAVRAGVYDTGVRAGKALRL